MELLMQITKAKNIIIIFFLLFQTVGIFTRYASTYPYISDTTFRAFCNHVISDRSTKFDPTKIKANDIIYVKTDVLKYFFKYYFRHKIKNPCILVTGSSDISIPGKFRKYLENPKLKAWFGRNIDILHPKLFALPIGVAPVFRTFMGQYRNNPSQYIQLLDSIALKPNNPEFPTENERKHLLYLNFTLEYPDCKGNPYEESRRKERKHVYELFKDKPFCFKSEQKPLSEYLYELTQCKFILSPRGWGLDCYRTWEALLSGCIPIVKSSILNILYTDLPILIINDRQEITEEFLIQKYKEMSTKKYNFKKLYADYWFNLMNSQKKHS